MSIGSVSLLERVRTVNQTLRGLLASRSLDRCRDSSSDIPLEQIAAPIPASTAVWAAIDVVIVSFFEFKESNIKSLLPEDSPANSSELRTSSNMRVQSYQA